MIPFTGTPSSWNELVSSLPLAHLLQTWEWSLVKTRFGWKAMPFIWKDSSGMPVAAAMVLKRSLPVAGFAKKMCVLYVPKGPCMDWADPDLRQKILEDLCTFAKHQGAIFIKIDADVVLGTGVPGAAGAVQSEAGQMARSELESMGWKFSQDQIQFRNTVLIDLLPTEEEMLARMKQKTRYNIRLAQRKGVLVRVGTVDDLPTMYRMYAETSVRDGFIIRDERYYQAVWQEFMKVSHTTETHQPFSEPLIAEVEGDIVGAVSIFYFSGHALYLFGMSRESHREKMPNYLLQWEAMRRAKALGCGTYNLWGAPDEFNESDELWNVFRFKEGLGGVVSRTIGAWDFTPNPFLYKTYTEILPRIMDIMRARGRVKTKQSLGGV
jgi:lipid II:glycine glycyltransferase (peptidoglycan interpeptide bridge formation enzyme)